MDIETFIQSLHTKFKTFLLTYFQTFSIITYTGDSSIRACIYRYELINLENHVQNFFFHSNQYALVSPGCLRSVVLQSLVSKLSMSFLCHLYKMIVW